PYPAHGRHYDQIHIPTFGPSPSYIDCVLTASALCQSRACCSIFSGLSYLGSQRRTWRSLSAQHTTSARSPFRLLASLVGIGFPLTSLILSTICRTLYPRPYPQFRIWLPPPKVRCSSANQWALAKSETWMKSRTPVPSTVG